MAAPILPVFAKVSNVPGDWKLRWDLIDQFVHRWQNISLPARDDAGGDKMFPPAVREWFAFVKHIRSSSSDCKLVDSMKSAEFTFDFGEADPTEHIPLLSDDGCRSVYVVPEKFWKQDDPAVHFYDATSEEDCGINRKSTTMFALSWVLQFSVGYDGSAGLPRKEEIVESTAKKVVTFLKKNVSKPSVFDDFQIFEKEDLFVALEPALQDGGEAEGKYLYMFGRGDANEALIRKIPGL